MGSLFSIPFKRATSRTLPIPRELIHLLSRFSPLETAKLIRADRALWARFFNDPHAQLLAIELKQRSPSLLSNPPTVARHPLLLGLVPERLAMNVMTFAISRVGEKLAIRTKHATVITQQGQRTIRLGKIWDDSGGHMEFSYNGDVLLYWSMSLVNIFSAVTGESIAYYRTPHHVWGCGILANGNVISLSKGAYASECVTRGDIQWTQIMSQEYTMLHVGHCLYAQYGHGCEVWIPINNFMIRIRTMGRVTNVAFDSEETLVAIATEGPTIELWSLKTHEFMFSTPADVMSMSKVIMLYGDLPCALVVILNGQNAISVIYRNGSVIGYFNTPNYHSVTIRNDRLYCILNGNLHRYSLAPGIKLPDML